MYSSVPLKSTQKADISSPVVRYGKKNLNKEGYQNLQKLMSSAEESRKGFIGITGYVNDLSITSSIEYYSFVSQIVDSFPVSEETPIGIQIKWNDIYKKNGTTTYNFAYEKACVLFNIGALHSKKAEAQSSSMESLSTVQIVINEYKEAANCFRFIHTSLFHSYTHDNRTWDMSDDALKGFENYCHALSQLAVAKKADLSGTKPFAKSSIMYGCERMFTDAANSFSLCESSGAAWSRLCTILAKVCRARAYMYLYDYQAAQLEVTSTGAGMMVGMADAVKKLTDDLLTNSRKAMSAALVNEVSELKKIASERYSEAMRTNRIYLESTVPPEQFPPVDAKILHPLTDPDIPNIGSAAFNDMVPQYVSDALVRYHEYVDGELNARLAQIETYNKQLTDTKEAFHVDDVIKSATTSQGIPEEVWMGIQGIQSQNGLTTVESTVTSMRSLADSVKQNFLKLNDEIMDLMNRATPQGKGALNGIMMDVKSYLGYLEEASSAEEKVDGQLKILRDNRMYITSSRADLEKLIPPVSLTGAANVALEELRKASATIDTVVENRQQKVNVIMQQAKEESVVRDELIRQKGNADERSVFNRAMTPINDQIHEIELDIQCQDSYITQLQTKVDAFNKVVSGDNSVMQRQSIMTAISNSVQAFTRVTSYVNEGIGFYQKAGKKYEALKQDFDRVKDSIQVEPEYTSNAEQYIQPNFPPQAPGYGQPGFPPQAPSYGQPGFPPQAPSYGQPGFPPQMPSYGQQGFPPQAPGYGQPGFPPQMPPYGQQGFPPQAPSYGQPGFPQQAPDTPTKVCKHCHVANNINETYCVSCRKMLYTCLLNMWHYPLLCLSSLVNTLLPFFLYHSFLLLYIVPY